MPYCPSCAREVDAAATECLHCGASFAAGSAWKPVNELSGPLQDIAERKWKTIPRPSPLEPITVNPIVAVFAAGGFGGGVTTILAQVYRWFRYGEWVSYSAIDGLKKLGNVWASYPEDWLGLYKLLDGIPLSLSCFIIGFAPGVIWVLGSDFTKSSTRPKNEA